MSTQQIIESWENGVEPYNATTKYKLVEKRNHLAVHALFDSLESAERHLKNTIPIYVAKDYFMDKTLTTDSFEIVPTS